MALPVTSKAFRNRLTRRARSAGVRVEPDVIDRLEVYFRVLARWNAKVNLTALPLDEPTDETFDRLLIEPLAAARTVHDSWTPWIDVGSGGGSPAIPLKLVKRGIRLTMVESKARKAAFLREAVRELGLADTAVETIRFEELASRPEVADTAGMVTLRAVRPDAKLMSCVARVLREQGQLLAFRQSKQGQRFEGFGNPSSAVLLAAHGRPAYLLRYERVDEV